MNSRNSHDAHLLGRWRSVEDEEAAAAGVDLARRSLSPGNDPVPGTRSPGSMAEASKSTPASSAVRSPPSSSAMAVEAVEVSISIDESCVARAR